MAEKKNSFEQAAEGKQRGLFAELLHFLAHNKKWWLTPIIILIVLISFLVVLGGTGVAPFIYSLF